MTLKSTLEGTWWYLTLDPGGTQQVRGVAAQDSNAGGGQTIIAGKIGGVYSADLGHNVNWYFVRPSGTVFVVH